MLIGNYSIANGVTLFGLISAVVSGCLAIHGDYKFAVYMMFIACVCNIFGGRIAKSKKEQKPKNYFFGKQISNLCSFIAFIITPCILAISLGFDSPFDVLIYCFFIASGAIRLTYLNSLEHFGEKKAKRYSGIPVYYMTFAITFLMITTTFIPAVATAWFFRLAFIAIGVLFILKLRIKKPAFKITLILLAVEIVLLLILVIAGDCKTLVDKNDVNSNETQVSETNE